MEVTMLKMILRLSLLLILPTTTVLAQTFEKDLIRTASGDLEISFIGHGTLMLVYAGNTIYIDPYSKLADYSKLPKADLILLTHEHRDHLDLQAISAIRTSETEFVVNSSCGEKLNLQRFLKNGESTTAFGINIEATPAYNLVHMRDNGQPFHPKGVGNGYILTIGGKRLYVAGDTENIPEMEILQDIDIAFLPMNLPYTMTPEMVADAAKAFRPKVLYPYHYGKTDPSLLRELLKKFPEIEVRIRKMP